MDLRNCDAIQGFKTIPRDSIDLILTDPPYLKDFLWTYSLLAFEGNRVLKPHKHLVAYSGNLHVPEALMRLKQVLTFRGIITLLHQEGHGSIWPTRMLAAAKPILVFTQGPIEKGSPFLVNVYHDKGASKGYHEWGQNIAFSLDIIKRLTKEGDTVLDPFLGGGTTAKACQILNRRCIGFEIDQKTFDIANKRMEETTLERFASGNGT